MTEPEKTYVCSRCGEEHIYAPGWDIHTAGDLRRVHVENRRISAIYLCYCGWPLAATVKVGTGVRTAAMTMTLE